MTCWSQPVIASAQTPARIWRPCANSGTSCSVASWTRVPPRRRPVALRQAPPSERPVGAGLQRSCAPAAKLTRVVFGPASKDERRRARSSPLTPHRRPGPTARIRVHLRVPRPTRAPTRGLTSFTACSPTTCSSAPGGGAAASCRGSSLRSATSVHTRSHVAALTHTSARSNFVASITRARAR